MGWFSEQIKTRIDNDEKSFEDSFLDLSSVVLGKSKIAANINNDRIKTQNAIQEILKYYRAKIVELPDSVEDMNAQMEYLLRPTGIMRRVVKLKGAWWKDAIGPMIGTTKSGDTVALMPYGINGYKFFDYNSQKDIKINSKTKDLIDDEAICFYKPFPQKELTLKDLVVYLIGTFSVSDIVMVIGAMIISTWIGMLSPRITQQIYNRVIPSGQVSAVLPIMTFYSGVLVSSSLIGITKSLINSRIQTKMDFAVQSAAMSRLLFLPATFFKNYSSGELANRTFSINQLCSMLVNACLSTGLPALFSFAYIFQMYQYSSALVVPSLIIVFLQMGFMILSTFMSLGINRKKRDIASKLDGVVFALFSGIQKIKLAGAEKRAFSKWAKSYKESASLEYDPPFVIKIMPIFSSIISLIGTLIIYYITPVTNVGQAGYMAFMSAYGQVSGAIMSLAGIATTIANIRPVMEMVEPILKAKPEVSENKKIVTKLSGAIEVSHLSFRYSEDSPLILDDVSLKIRPGQYIAIVGKTGCGKSTLMRLILGFETPKNGAIYYDGKDISKLDLKSLRQHMGVVMQNGKLFAGDVYSNIVISAPWLNLDAAWEAAEMAGVANDIRDMPMGMNTLISEGSGGVSGGQRQRLMIARAIAPKPKILMFDEATSALDNITQKQVSDSLNSLKSTRIVIAHRLSTIKQCDRIIVLDKGKIIEDGKYDELIAKKGFFAELVERQRINNED